MKTKTTATGEVIMPTPKPLTHTPTPWHVEKGLSLYKDALPYCVGKSQDGTMTPFQTGGTRAEANAAFIVRAVNAHESLVKTLQKVQDWLKDKYVVENDGNCRAGFAHYVELIDDTITRAQKGE